MYPTKDTTQKTKQMNKMDPTRYILLICLVFCVVVFGAVHLAHLFSFLCCGLWWGTSCSSV
jgi:Flp pilus assembly protein TadB